jgi:Spy/CpxP family protein refolding chaperone
MKFTQIRSVIAIAVLFSVPILFISSDAEAFPPGMGGPDRLGKGHHRPPCAIWQDTEMVRQLELTSGQVKKLKDADFTFKETHLELKTQCSLLHLQLEKALSEDKVDEASVQKVAQKLADAKGKIFVQSIMFRLKTDEILTPKQRSQLRSFGCREKPPERPHPKRPHNPYPKHP